MPCGAKDTHAGAIDRGDPLEVDNDMLETGKGFNEMPLQLTGMRLGELTGSPQDSYLFRLFPEVDHE